MKTKQLSSLWENPFTDFFTPDAFFGTSFSSTQIPAVNVKETEDAYFLELATPGMQKEDFNISIENGRLTVTAQREQNETKKEEKFTHQEFSFTSFHRTFTLPENTDEDQVEASYEEGILKLKLTKNVKKQSQSKAIEIH